MNIIRPILGGLIGGVVGVFIWVEVSYFTHYEMGFIAWGVGFLVGLGVRYAARLGEQEVNNTLGFLSAGVAISGILIAKYLVFLSLSSYVHTFIEGLNAVDDQGMIAKFANDIVEEKTEQGVEIKWPPNVNPDIALAKEDFPPEIWREAEKKWNDSTPQVKDMYRQLAQQKTKILKQMNTYTFRDSFTFLDILWFALATITAYKIGTGSHGQDRRM